MALPIADHILVKDRHFWAKVKPVGSCWKFQGAKTAKGYGRFFVKPKVILAHRHAFALAYGAIPEGMHVCHKCDNPSCVRPDHLFAGTRSDNMQDMHSKGRYRGGNKVVSYCRGCGRELPVEAFHKEPRVSSGRASRCIECINRARRSTSSDGGVEGHAYEPQGHEMLAANEASSASESGGQTHPRGAGKTGSSEASTGGSPGPSDRPGLGWELSDETQKHLAEIEKYTIRPGDPRLNTLFCGQTGSDPVSGRSQQSPDVSVDELALVLDRLVNAPALKGVRELVAGWNGENRPEGPYKDRHPNRLGATLPKTNCGAVYELDEAMQSARALLANYRIERLGCLPSGRR